MWIQSKNCCHYRRYLHCFGVECFSEGVPNNQRFVFWHLTETKRLISLLFSDWMHLTVWPAAVRLFTVVWVNQTAVCRTTAGAGAGGAGGAGAGAEVLQWFCSGPAVVLRWFSWLSRTCWCSTNRTCSISDRPVWTLSIFLHHINFLVITCFFKTMAATPKISMRTNPIPMKTANCTENNMNCKSS